MKNFKIEEFDFKGANGYPAEKAAGKMDTSFLEMLDKARDIAGVPFTITSGYRPEDYDRELHKIPNSDHSQGCGADISTPNAYITFQVMRGLIMAGFKRIGVGANKHIHVGGNTSALPQNVFWLE